MMQGDGGRGQWRETFLRFDTKTIKFIFTRLNIIFNEKALFQCDLKISLLVFAAFSKRA